MSKLLSTGEEEAFRRIALEAERRTGLLDLSGLGLTAIPPGLSELKHLKELSLNRNNDLARSQNRISDIAPLANLVALRLLTLREQAVADLTALSGMRDLKYLDVAHNPILDFSPLTPLRKLLALDCNNCKLILWNTGTCQ